MLKLYIGNKNYSSWSMRPWTLLTQCGIPFEEVPVRMDSLAPGSAFKRRLAEVSPAGKVPVLTDGEVAVWDTLAIAEYLAEKFPDLHLWPADRVLRARARSVCAEMHSGFGAFRSACSMNVEAHLPDVGAIIWRDRADVRADVARIAQIWSDLLRASGGPMLCGAFGIADAYFTPAMMRVRSYALPLPEAAASYLERVCALPGVQAWIAAALAEHDFLAFEEPYRVAR